MSGVTAKETVLDQARRAAQQALDFGADAAKVGVSRSRGVDVEWRDGQLERVQERTQRGLSVSIYVDGRFSSSSTNDLRPDALADFIREAVDMTRLLEPDPYRCLPDPSAYEGRADVDLDLCDPSHATQSSVDRRSRAQQIEALVRDKHPDLPIISVSTSVSDSWGQSARVSTNGFEGVREGTHFSASAAITAKDADGRRPMGWDYTSRRHFEDLESLDKLAQEAGVRTRHQLGAGKIKTGKYTILLENRATPRLLGAFLGPISGPALQQKRSLWDGKVGTAIASSLLTIHDAPHRVRGPGSSLWDSDGYATHARPIIEGGVLSTYLIDHYYALKMGVERTGGDTHNLDWALGDRDLEGLAADIGEGVLIDRFLGGNSNSTSGELSFGCAGRMIRGGKICEPVAEMNLAGNLSTIMHRLVAVGNDPNPNSAAGCPSIVIEDVQISGE